MNDGNKLVLFSNLTDEEDPYHSIKDVTRGTGDFQYLPGEEENRLKRLNEMPRGQRLVISY